MAFNFSPKIVTDGLVLYYDAANTKSYLSGSTTWNDLSRANNNGTLVNGPTYSSANIGSIVFDGVNDYVNCGTNSSLNISGSITVESWVYLSSLSNSSDICLISKYSNSGGSNQSWILFKSTQNYQSFGPGGSGGPANNEFGWISSSNGTISGAFIGTGEQVLINTWYHVVGVFNSFDNSMQIYVNGVLKRNSVRTGQSFGVLATNSININIGATSADSNRWLQGRLPTARIYNKALTAADVLQNYNTTKGRYGL